MTWKSVKMKSTINIALVGARGYIGKELITLLNTHPLMNLVAAFSRELTGERVQGSESQLTYQSSTPESVSETAADAFILALPNGYTEPYAQAVKRTHPQAVIIDLSADKRFDPLWQYSLPELHKHRCLKYISNPGCYATAMQLGIAPLLSVLDGPVHCFGISGYSGAGTSPSDNNNPQRLQDNIIPYQLCAHTHEKEVTHALHHQVYFSPHVASFFRGLGITLQVKLQNILNKEDIYQLFSDFYRTKPLIKVSQNISTINQVANKHYAHISGFHVNQQQLAFHVTLDNLLKGAATQAIQNLNSAFNLPSTLGINYD